MECEFIAHHIRRRDSGPRAPHSLDAARKVLGRLLETSSPSHGFQKHSKALDGHLQKYSTPAGLDYEELGGLSDPGQ